MTRASILITSYNQKRFLECCLESLSRQSVRDFEIIIADDGSADGTRQLCASFGNAPLKFITQKDEGYRKAVILNTAIAESESDYLIFIDSDVICERHFIEDHLALRKNNHFVCGRRVDLGPIISTRITPQSVTAGDLDRINTSLLLGALRGDTFHVKRALRIRNPWIRKLMGYDRPIDLLGSNMSMWKEDLLAVNGFNEALKTYWGEDGDLFIRFRNSGKLPLNAKGLCIQYHLFHPRREPDAQTMKWYEEALKDFSYKRTQQGYAERIALRAKP